MSAQQRLYRVFVLFSNGADVTQQVWAENALCAILRVGQMTQDEPEPISVQIKEI